MIIIKHFALLRHFILRAALCELLKTPKYLFCWLKTRHKPEHIMSMAGVCIITCQKCGKTLEFYG